MHSRVALLHLYPSVCGASLGKSFAVQSLTTLPDVAFTVAYIENYTPSIPLITPQIVPYRIPYITPFKGFRL